MIVFFTQCFLIIYLVTGMLCCRFISTRVQWQRTEASTLLC